MMKLKEKNILLPAKRSPNMFEIDYKQVEVDPAEMQLRLKLAYALVFEEVIKRRKASIDCAGEGGLNATREA